MILLPSCCTCWGRLMTIPKMWLWDSPCWSMKRCCMNHHHGYWRLSTIKVARGSYLFMMHLLTTTNKIARLRPTGLSNRWHYHSQPDLNHQLPLFFVNHSSLSNRDLPSWPPSPASPAPWWAFALPGGLQQHQLQYRAQHHDSAALQGQLTREELCFFFLWLSDGWYFEGKGWWLGKWLLIRG